MKRNMILAVIAILLLTLYTGVAILLFLLVLPLAYFFLKQKEKREQTKGTQAGSALDKFTSLESVVAEYGEPDDSVIINASKANEPAGIILIYVKGDFLIVDGEKISMTDIIGVSAKNMATPYTVGEYQIIFSTRIKGRELIRVNAGYDAVWAGEAVGQIHKYLCRKLQSIAVNVSNIHSSSQSAISLMLFINMILGFLLFNCSNLSGKNFGLLKSSIHLNLVFIFLA